MNKNLKSLSFLLTLLFLSACSGGSANDFPVPDGHQPLFKLTGALATVAEDDLTGKLFVYETINGKLLITENLTINDSGVSSPIFNLTRATEYRFVVIFYWQGVAIAYVNTIQTTANADTTNIRFTEDMIVYTNATSSEDPNLSADVSSGVLPNLDPDGDGFDTFTEFKAGTDPNDEDSVPNGPSITFAESIFSNDGNTLTISATIYDGTGIVSANLGFTGADYLKAVLENETITKDADNKNWIYSATFNPQYASVGDLEITLTATDTLTLSTTKEKTVFITDNGQNVGTIIVFESVAEGENLSGTIPLSIKAYDRDGVASVTVTNLTVENGLATNTSTVADRFIANWDTTQVNDKNNYLITVEAIDGLGMSDDEILSVNIANTGGDDLLGPNVGMDVFVYGTSTTFDYENGREVFGKLKIIVSSTDLTSGVNALAWLNSDAFDAGTGTPSQATASLYINSLDTTQLSDGEWQLEFRGTDGKGNIKNRTFSITIANHPIINSFTVNATNSVTLDVANPTTNFAWDIDYADAISISNITTGEIVLSSLGLSSTGTSFTPTTSGTYRLTATQTTNRGNFTATKDVTINLVDVDNDGFNFAIDCNDSIATLYPGATEILDGIDNDCDATVDQFSLGDSNTKFIGEDEYNYAGYSVSNEGDINGDGFNDILIGAPDADNNYGAAYLIYGHADWDGQIDLSQADAKFTGISFGDGTGGAVSDAGDVNGDGFDDILVLAYNADSNGSNAGSVYLIYGQAENFRGNINLSIAAAKFIGEQAGDAIGKIATGDVDGDGLDDILIGASSAPGEVRIGAVYLIYGSETKFSGTLTANLKITGEQADDSFGYTISNAGDVNGDGTSDILVGANQFHNPSTPQATGKAYLFYGGIEANKLLGNMSAIDADVIITGEAAGDEFGYAVSNAGDVDGDGKADMLIGAIKAGGGVGVNYLIYGSDHLNNTIAAYDLDVVKFIGENVGDSAGGFANAIAGDINHDGFADILISAPGNDSVNKGQVYLIYGGDGENVLSGNINLSNADAKFTGENGGDFAGFGLDAGDVNGDEYNDILIGAFLEDTEGTNAGAAYLILSAFE